ncbi:unannotated protein [freshwater metagenome]|uniref:Unannotated protein n=1 Tax=freshwater metagenome TaxID=449393 RepID=A0A6J6GP67_9ZZZZ
MHQLGQVPQLSYQRRRQYEKRFERPSGHPYYELHRQRAHLRELRATFRYNRRVQKMLRRQGRRLIDRYEYRHHLEVQIKARRRLLRSKKGCGTGEIKRPLLLLELPLRFRAFWLCHHWPPIPVHVMHRQRQGLRAKSLEPHRRG